MDEKLYSRIVADNISKRYLSHKTQGLVEKDRGALKLKKNASVALKEGKNLLIFGKTGIGKSYLAFDLAFDLKAETNGEVRVFYNRAALIHSDYRASYNNISKVLSGVMAKPSFYFEEPPTPTELIIIDEIDDLVDYTIIDEIIISAYDNAVPLIIIGNISYDEFAEGLSEKAMSRLQENLEILTLDGNDLRKGDNE